LEQDNVARPAILKGDAMDEDQVLSGLNGNGFRMTQRDIYSFRLLLAIVFGYWEMAEMLVNLLEAYLMNDGFIVRSAMRRSTVALACLKLYHMKGKKKHRTIAKKIMKEVEKDLKNGSINSHSLYLMLQAEESPSKERYDSGIRGCARLGLIHFEAYLCERAAEFFLERNDEGWAEYYLGQAFVLYEDWGARGKANRLKDEHLELLKSSNLREKASTALRGRSRYNSEHLDAVKDFNWEQLSSMSSSGTLSVFQKGATSATAGSERSTETSSEASGILAPGLFADPMS